MELGDVMFDAGQRDVARCLPAGRRQDGRAGARARRRRSAHQPPMATARRWPSTAPKAVQAALLAKLPPTAGGRADASACAPTSTIPRARCVTHRRRRRCWARCCSTPTSPRSSRSTLPVLEKIARDVATLAAHARRRWWWAWSAMPTAAAADGYNTALGLRRAKAVFDAIAVAARVPKSRASCASTSSDNPTAPVGIRGQ